jgi:hypothetical protein
MTPAQDDVIEQVKRLLDEHFDSYICVVDGEAVIEGKEDDSCGHIRTLYGGGCPAAVGLAYFGKRQILKGVSDNDLR